MRVEEGAARDRVVVRHPLQPFDPRNFERGALVAGRTWSFDAITLEGARALAGERGEPAPFLSELLPALEAGLSLGALQVLRPGSRSVAVAERC